MSAIGLVLVTVAVVGVIAHEAIDLPWAMSFALGAIVAPTDPVAATAIMRRLGAPRRIVNLVRGRKPRKRCERPRRVPGRGRRRGRRKLLGPRCHGHFAGAVAGGVAIGLGTGWVVAQIRRRVDDPTTGSTISLLTGYAAFLPAEELHVSGVLAAVTAGLYMGWHAPTIVSPEGRLQSGAMWEVLTFLLNAALFILIGLQLPLIVNGLDTYTTGRGDRLLGAHLRHRDRYEVLVALHHAVRPPRRRPPPRSSGSAASTPPRASSSVGLGCAEPSHSPPRWRCRWRQTPAPRLPGRDLILFITFALILFTVVGQGLTLPWLIRRLGLVDDGEDEQHEEIKARLVIARAALDRVDELEGEEWTRDETLERVRALYQFRKRRFAAQAGAVDGTDGIEERSLAYQRLMHEIYTSQREALVELRNGRRISVEVMRRVERELDLEEQRLEV